MTILDVGLLFPGVVGGGDCRVAIGLAGFNLFAALVFGAVCKAVIDAFLAQGARPATRKRSVNPAFSGEYVAKMPSSPYK